MLRPSTDEMGGRNDVRSYVLVGSWPGPVDFLGTVSRSGGCTATGMGEEVLKTVGAFLVVELMRQGKTPQAACEEAIRRIVKKAGDRFKDFQVGLIAVNKQGETGAYCIHEWFNYNVYANGENKNYKSDFYNKA